MRSNPHENKLNQLGGVGVVQGNCEGVEMCFQTVPSKNNHARPDALGLWGLML